MDFNPWTMYEPPNRECLRGRKRKKVQGDLWTMGQLCSHSFPSVHHRESRLPKGICHHCPRICPSPAHSTAQLHSSLPRTCCLAGGLESSFLPFLAGATPPVLPHLCSAPEPSGPALLLPTARGSRFGTRRIVSPYPELTLTGTQRISKTGLSMGPYTQDMAPLPVASPFQVIPDNLAITTKAILATKQKRGRGNTPGPHLVAKHKRDDFQHV